MSNLFYRVVTSIILLPIVIVAFVNGGHFLTAFLWLVCNLCCLEVARIIQPKNRRARFFSLFFCSGFFVPMVLESGWPVAIVALFVIHFLFNAVVLFVTNLKVNEFEKLSAIFYWCLYVTFAVLCVYWLINAPLGFSSRVGLSFVYLACLATWANDTFAYFGGRLFGKRPLFPAVSAKKTWEGFVCGGLMSIIAIIALAYGSRAAGVDVFAGLSLGDLLWVAMPAIVLAPIGDLMESRLKRLYDTKDSSNILPGHGGLLDRIDALLLVFPWTTLYAFILRPIW